MARAAPAEILVPLPQPSDRIQAEETTNGGDQGPAEAAPTDQPASFSRAGAARRASTRRLTNRVSPAGSSNAPALSKKRP